MSAITGVGVVMADAIESPRVEELLRGERTRALNSEAKLLLAAARLALHDAGLTEQEVRSERLGVVVATRHAGHRDYVALFLAGIERDGHVNPARGPQTGLNAPAALVSIRLGAAGPNATLSNGAVGGLDALRYAADALAAERAAAMLVCGVDVEPQAGPPLGGAAVVVLEPSTAKRTRSVCVRARVAGLATAFSPHDDLPEATARSLDEALRAAGVATNGIRASFGAESTGADGVAAVAQLARAASSLHRRDTSGPVAVCASDAPCSAGVAVLVEPDWRTS